MLQIIWKKKKDFNPLTNLWVFIEYLLGFRKSTTAREKVVYFMSWHTEVAHVDFYLFLCTCVR